MRKVRVFVLWVDGRERASLPFWVGQDGIVMQLDGARTECRLDEWNSDRSFQVLRDGRHMRTSWPRNDACWILDAILQRDSKPISRIWL